MIYILSCDSIMDYTLLCLCFIIWSPNGKKQSLFVIITILQYFVLPFFHFNYYSIIYYWNHTNKRTSHAYCIQYIRYCLIITKVHMIYQSHKTFIRKHTLRSLFGNGIIYDLHLFVWLYFSAFDREGWIRCMYSANVVFIALHISCLLCPRSRHDNLSVHLYLYISLTKSTHNKTKGKCPFLNIRNSLWSHHVDIVFQRYTLYCISNEILLHTKEIHTYCRLKLLFLLAVFNWGSSWPVVCVYCVLSCLVKSYFIVKWSNSYSY